MEFVIKHIKTHDGYTFKSKLSLPEGDGDISRLIIFSSGTGPGTYNDTFCFSPELYNKSATAFLSFNRRGIDVMDAPPYYSVNIEEYKKHNWQNSVEDIFNIITTLKMDSRLKNCKVLLCGCSEGAIIMTEFAYKYPGMVDALFLVGYTTMSLR